MKSSNLRINISFKNDKRDFVLYEYLINKRDKSSYIKTILEKAMLEEICDEMSKST